MPDSGIADNTGLSSSFFDTYVRQQVIAQLATASLPAAATAGRFFADTTTKQLKVDTGSALLAMLSWDTGPTFTPTITASTTSPTGWTTSGAYITFGKWILATATFTFGAGTAASGTLRFGLPVVHDSSGLMLGRIECNDSGTQYMRHPVAGGATSYITAVAEAGTAVTGAVPFTPAAADFYRYTILYRTT